MCPQPPNPEVNRIPQQATDLPHPLLVPTNSNFQAALAETPIAPLSPHLAELDAAEPALGEVLADYGKDDLAEV